MNKRQSDQTNPSYLQKAPRRMLFTLLGLAIAIIAFFVLIYPMAMVGTPKTEIIKIPANATMQNLSDTLSKYYGDSFAGRVMRLVKIRKPDLAARHGAYSIPEGSNALRVTRRLLRGAQAPVKITINGFRNFDEMITRISRKLDFTPDSLKKAATNADTLKPYGLTPEQAMALFLDDTYEFYWSASPQQVVEKIGANYQKMWDSSRRSKAEALGLSPAQVMIISSIVDEETNAGSEKGAIGRLYINRYKKGMRLQADPTVRFANNDFTIRRVKGEHLNADSPYNTYKYAGLPPAPIRTVGRTTIDLILNSEPNDYLYMCAKEDFSGTHNFAATYEEHMANAKRYQRVLDERGIK